MADPIDVSKLAPVKMPVETIPATDYFEKPPVCIAYDAAEIIKQRLNALKNTIAPESTMMAVIYQGVKDSPELDKFGAQLQMLYKLLVAPKAEGGFGL